MRFSNQIKQDETLRNAFFALANKVHGLDLDRWYDAGWWDDSYIPYTYFDNGKAVANVSVFDLHFALNGEAKHYIQLSTVMTDPDYRRQGLATDLLRRVIADWKNKCDGIFLFSSDMALKLYASVGLLPKLESVWTYPSKGDESCLKRLDLTDPADMQTFLHCFEKGNPFSTFSAVGDLSLVMFYLGGFMADCVYYHEAEDAVLIIDGDNLLWEVFGGNDFARILSALPQGDITIGFTPKDQAGLRRKVANHQLFWMGEACPFDLQAACLPQMAHA